MYDELFELSKFFKFRIIYPCTFLKKAAIKKKHEFKKTEDMYLTKEVKYKNYELIWDNQEFYLSTSY